MRGVGRSAVLGIVAGSLTRDLAARIPDGAPVLFDRHPDAAGDAYAAAAHELLGARCDLRFSQVEPRP